MKEVKPAPATGPGNEGFSPPPRAEWIRMFCLLGVFFLFNLATWNFYPAIWCDDVTWSEPAINLAKTGHMTTSVWQFQPPGTVWAVNPPLYVIVLSGWVKILGGSALGVRSFNFFLFSLAMLLVWRVSWKARLARTEGQRLMLLLLLQFGYGLSFSYRCSRPDILGMVCLTGLYLFFLGKAGPVRTAGIFLVGMACAWTGFQIVLFAGLALFAGWTLFRSVKLGEIVTISLGTGAGVGSLLGYYATNGSWQYFLKSVSHVAGEQTRLSGGGGYLASLPHRLIGTVSGYVGDFSLLPVLAALGYLWFFGGVRTSPRARSWLARAGLIYLGIPLVFNLTAHFAFYYSYMVYVPLVLALCAACAESAAAPGNRARRSRIVVGLGVALAVLVGLPFRLAMTAAFCHVAPRSEVADAVRAGIATNDVVFSEYTAFFEAKQIASTIYTPMASRSLHPLSDEARDFTASEKKGVTAMIVPPAERDFYRQFFGGEWEAVGRPFGDTYSLGEFGKIPFFGPRLDHHFHTPQTMRFQVQVFRRVPGS